MVARINFRLIIILLLFFKLQSDLNSQDKMKDINISINEALESYKSKNKWPNIYTLSDKKEDNYYYIFIGYLSINFILF